MTFLDAYYASRCRAHTNISAHLPRLRDLARGMPVVVEFGVGHGASSSALLLGSPRVISYDIVERAQARALAARVPRWSYRLQDTLMAPVEPCDLLFIDSRHTYAHTSGELDRHADAVRSRLVFHDVVTFGDVGEDGDRPGIQQAIDDLLARDPTWQVAARYPDSHGLLVLERRP